MKHAYRLSVLVVLLTGALAARSQWVDLPAANDLGTGIDNWFFNDNTGVACGAHIVSANNLDGRILRTADGGDTWSTVVSRPGERLNELCFVNDLVGYCVGDSGSLYRTTDGGVTWDWSDTGIDHPLWHVCFTANGTGWVSTLLGGVYRSTDGGDTWTAVPGGTLPNFNRMRFTSATEGHYVNTYRIYATTDGGATWTEQPTGLSAGSLRDIRFRNSSSGCAIGWDGLALATSDGGTTWTNVFTGTTADLYTLAIAPNGVGFAGGNGANNVLVTADGGASWSVSSVSSAWMTGSTMLSSGIGYLTGWSGEVWRYTGPVGFDELKGRQPLVVFPVPLRSESQVVVPARMASGHTWQLLDGLGRPVLQGRGSGSAFRLQRGDAPAGVYVLTLTSDAGERAAQRLVIE